MNFTLKQLEYFRALATLGNFGRAAEASNISQPALSVQIRTLEESLGGRLIERQSRASVLTPLGREVLTRAEDILRRAKLLEATAREQVGLAGTLNLGLIPTVAPYLLPGVLAALRAQDISLRVEVREAQTDQLLADLRAGALDAAVMAVPVEPAALAWSSSRCLTTSSQHFLVASHPVTHLRERLVTPQRLSQPHPQHLRQ